MKKIVKASAPIKTESLRPLGTREYLNCLYKASQIMVWVNNSRHDCVFANRPLLEYVGLSLKEVLGFAWRKVIHPDDLGRTEPYFHYKAQNYTAYRVEIRMRRFDGQYRWCLSVGVPRHDPKGEFEGYLGQLVDIHDQKSRECELRHQQTALEKQLLGIRKIVDQMLQGTQEREFTTAPSGIEKLSLRELQVLKSLGEGKTSRKIAEELSVGIKTVNTYLIRIRQKLKITATGNLAHFAFLWCSQSDQVGASCEKPGPILSAGGDTQDFGQSP